MFDGITHHVVLLDMSLPNSYATKFGVPQNTQGRYPANTLLELFGYKFRLSVSVDLTQNYNEWPIGRWCQQSNSQRRKMETRDRPFLTETSHLLRRKIPRSPRIESWFPNQMPDEMEFWRDPSCFCFVFPIWWWHLRIFRLGLALICSRVVFANVFHIFDKILKQACII